MGAVPAPRPVPSWQVAKRLSALVSARSFEQKSTATTKVVSLCPPRHSATNEMTSGERVPLCSKILLRIHERCCRWARGESRPVLAAPSTSCSSLKSLFSSTCRRDAIGGSFKFFPGHDPGGPLSCCRVCERGGEWPFRRRDGGCNARGGPIAKRLTRPGCTVPSCRLLASPRARPYSLLAESPTRKLLPPLFDRPRWPKEESMLS